MEEIDRALAAFMNECRRRLYDMVECGKRGWDDPAASDEIAIDLMDDAEAACMKRDCLHLHDIAARAMMLWWQKYELELSAYSNLDSLDPLVLLREVRDHFREVHPYSDDAPGHCHYRRGRWNADGSPCAWCATWQRVQACLKQNVASLMKYEMKRGRADDRFSETTGGGMAGTL